MLHFIMVSLGQSLYLWRISKGLSQEELAQKAGIPRPNLTTIESGRREPSLSTLRALAAALGIKTGTLIDGIAPINFGDSLLSRSAQEAIVKASLSKNISHLSAQQKIISSLLSNIVRNKINAKKNRFSKHLLKERGVYIKNWLILKAAINPHLLNKLLTQVDKYI